MRQTGAVEILDTIDLGSSAVVLRRAEAGDVPAIVGLPTLGVSPPGCCEPPGCVNDAAARWANGVCG